MPLFYSKLAYVTAGSKFRILTELVPSRAGEPEEEGEERREDVVGIVP